MADETRNERDLILAPNEYAHVNDATKGSVECYVGPFKTSLAGTDRCVVFDTKSKRFKPVNMSEGTLLLVTAPEGFYISLKNPAEGGKHPSGSGKLTTPTLQIGKKVNISGPVSFALWPGQMAKVLQGHTLRSNEYLLVRVYDEEAAKTHWNNAVVKTQTDAPGDAGDMSSDKGGKTKKGLEPTFAKTSLELPTENELTMGKLFVVRGTHVSFYIPPTGVEVVPERVNNEDRYVREAVSLERLEYCLLLDQSGTKRYEHGPAVVFPRPTEKFVEAAIKSNPDKAKAKKFRAQELTPASGIHIRVIADYAEADGTKRKAGDELFVTGREQTIYFPREEHAIIKYGEQDIHYGIAIPTGEARYVLNRDDGVIRLVRGPQIFLPDPRKDVIVNRALPLNTCELMYPGNAEAIAINATRLGEDSQDYTSAGGGLLMNDSSGYSSDSSVGAVAVADTTRRVMIRGASKTLPGDAFDRKNKFTAPRSIVLNTKFEGAVSSDVWTGYAMLLVSKSGDRRVIRGPQTVMLEYDESPQVLTLSRGKPKTMENPLKTVFLLTTANKVSDIIEVETRDFCRLHVKVSYRVNFEGDDPEKWFSVDNYVKFLCDHMRSRVRSAVQKLSVEEFYGNNAAILRDIVLGKSPGEGKQRTGMTFDENNMRIYDVEVLSVMMQNQDVEKMLIAQQRDVMQNTLIIAGERRKLAYIQESETLKRQIAETNAETAELKMKLESEATKRKLELDLTIIEANAKTEAERIRADLDHERGRNEIEDAKRAQHTLDRENGIVLDKKAQEVRLEQLRAEVKAIVDKAAAFSPDIIAALSAFGERAMVERVSTAMAPLSIIGGESVIDVLRKLLEGTSIAKQLNPITNGSGNIIGRTEKSKPLPLP